MGQPKSKRSAMLDPRHRAVLLKEKYRQQMERQDTDAENAETQAVGRVESAAEWAAEELRERVPQAPKKKLPVEEFMKLQGRFKHCFKPGNEWTIEAAQQYVDEKWEKLLARCGK